MLLSISKTKTPTRPLCWSCLQWRKHEVQSERTNERKRSVWTATDKLIDYMDLCTGTLKTRNKVPFKFFSFLFSTIIIAFCIPGGVSGHLLVSTSPPVIFFALNWLFNLPQSFKFQVEDSSRSPSPANANISANYSRDNHSHAHTWTTFTFCTEIIINIHCQCLVGKRIFLSVLLFCCCCCSTRSAWAWRFPLFLHHHQ